MTIEGLMQRVTALKNQIVALALRVTAAESVTFIMACSDQTSDIVAANGVFTFRVPHGVLWTDARASLKEASTAGDVQVDVTAAGDSLFIEPLTIDEGDKTSLDSASPFEFDPDMLEIADDVEVSVDIQINGADAVGLVVTLIGQRI